MEIDEKWGSGKRYFDMAEYFEWCRSKTQKKLLEALLGQGRAQPGGSKSLT